MRRIAYWLNNKVFADILLRFCEMENFLAVDLSKGCTDGCNYVFFLTDDKNKLKEYENISDAPCMIEQEARFSHSHYILSEQFGLTSLRILMDNIHHGGTLWNTVHDVSFVKVYKELQVPNCMEEIERLVIQTTWELLYYCSFSDVEKIRIGFSEMLTNAIEHGNLGITDDDKHESTENGTYRELLAEKLADPRYKDRKVHITLNLTNNQLTIIIKDEGTGFDTSSFPSPNEPEKLLNLHGRGILITRAYFDTVSYNEKGNEVTLIKVFNEC